MKRVILFILITSVFPTFGQDEATLPKDVTISIGAGKNRFFEEREFVLAAPLSVPFLINVGIFKNTEFGVEFNPIFFNDRSAYNLSTTVDSTRNHFSGNLLNFNGNIQHSIVNNFRMSGYVKAGLGYSALHKKQWIVGKYNELLGSGYNYSFGGGLRYQLGNEYDDVFPWYFDFSILYTGFNLKIDNFLIDDVRQPASNDSWDPLKFGSIDVILRLGYRFRKK